MPLGEKNQKLSYIWASLAIFFWASAFPGIKYALRFYSPPVIMLFRFVVATLALIAVAMVKRMKLLPEREDIPFFILTGGIGIFVYMWLFNVGTGMVESGVSSFIIAASPVFTLILSLVFLKERVSGISVLGIGISALGLIIIAVSKVAGFEMNLGIVILIGAALCTSCYNMLLRKILVKYSGLSTTLFAFIFGTIPMFAFLPQFLRELPAAPASANWMIVYMGIFPGAVSYMAWNYAISYAEKVATVANFMYLNPFIASGLAYLFLGEVLPPLAFVGGMVIVLGLLVANWGPVLLRRRRKAAETQ